MLSGRDKLRIVEVSLTREVARPPLVVWPVIGGFFDLGKWLDVDCVRVTGSGEIGSVRRVGSAILEPLIAKTSCSYTYGQIKGPMAALYYHGTVACEHGPDSASVIRYSLVFDATQMEEAVCKAEQQRLKMRFGAAVDAMVSALS